MRSHPNQSEIAEQLDFRTRVQWAAAVTRDFADVYSSSQADRDLITRILALEDRRFFQHKGVDWRGLAREVRNLVTGKPVFGASTITMQLVRIATGDFSNSITRKLVEILAAQEVERRMRKWRILTAYYNSAYIGSGIREWDDLVVKLKPVFRDQGVSYEIMASCLASPVPAQPTEKWVERTIARAGRISEAVARFPLSADYQRIITNNIKHVPIEGVRLSV